MRAHGAGATREVGRAVRRDHARAPIRYGARALAGARPMKPRALGFAAASLVLAALTLLVGPSFGAETRDFVLLELRLPRLLVGALVGGTLSTSGAAFQAIFNNALATPSTVGTT